LYEDKGYEIQIQKEVYIYQGKSFPWFLWIRKNIDTETKLWTYRFCILLFCMLLLLVFLYLMR